MPKAEPSACKPCTVAIWMLHTKTAYPDMALSLHSWLSILRSASANLRLPLLQDELERARTRYWAAEREISDRESARAALTMVRLADEKAGLMLGCQCVAGMRYAGLLLYCTSGTPRACRGMRTQWGLAARAAVPPSGAHRVSFHRWVAMLAIRMHMSVEILLRAAWCKTCSSSTPGDLFSASRNFWRNLPLSSDQFNWQHLSNLVRSSAS